MLPVVQAYFDESGSHAGSPVLCVAGYAFEKREARFLATEWTRVLEEYDLPFFHMVDCAHGNNAFRELTQIQRIKVETALIGIIKRRSAQGFAVTVDPVAYEEMVTSWAPTESAYAFCARCVIDEMGRWFHQIGFRGRSSYFFEDGHGSRTEADEVVAAVLNNPLNGPAQDVHYGYADHSFIAKEDNPAVQAADLLAWQCATDIKHMSSGRPRRMDFQSLLDGPAYVRRSHFDRARLAKWILQMEEFGLGSKRERTTFEDVLRVLYVRERSRLAMGLVPHQG